MVWSIEDLYQFYHRVRTQTGVYVDCLISEADSGAYPLFWAEESGELCFVPHFFNHDFLTEEMKTMLALVCYSEVYLRRARRDRSLDINPEVLAKGICDRMGLHYITVSDILAVLEKIRPILFFGESAVASGPLCEGEFPQLDLGGLSIDLRKNLFILSAPSGCGKNTVYRELNLRLPHIQRAITVTTRAPRSNELNGVDYYFISEDDFIRQKEAGMFAEDAYYDNAYYGTPISEIERYSEDVPVFLIIDRKGKRNITNRRYPLATTIFLMPPSLDELLRRIEKRGENSREEIERRQQSAKTEIEHARFYDYIVENNDLEACVTEIIKIINKK